jgi:quercetin dioxygenase-like cupin family protein
MPETPEILTPADMLSRESGPGPVWTRSSADLNVNLLSFDQGQGVPAHVNDEVDVLLVVVAGEGVLELSDTPRPLRAGQVCLIPKGVTRAIRSAGGPFAYLTCHRRRAGLMPV